MKLTIESVVVYADDENDFWHIDVRIEATVSHEILGPQLQIEAYKVYANADDLRVTGAGWEAKRTKFQWTDWIFDNIGGNVEAAAAVAAIAVWGDTTQRPPIPVSETRILNEEGEFDGQSGRGQS